MFLTNQKSAKGSPNYLNNRKVQSLNLLIQIISKVQSLNNFFLVQ